jgi:hypothetical protein
LRERAAMNNDRGRTTEQQTYLYPGKVPKYDEQGDRPVSFTEAKNDGSVGWRELDHRVQTFGY